jgi:hypothetical protein
MAIDFDEFAAPSDFDRDPTGAPEVRNPNSKEFVRRHADWCSSEVVLVKVASKYYLVHHGLCPRLRGHAFKAKLAATASSESGTYFLWPIKPDNESMVKAAEEAKSSWVGVVWQNSSKSYRTEKPAEDIQEPSWPFSDFKQMADMAFGDRKIHDPEDPIIKKILGIKESGEQS